jgi:filamentous hemagglutinin family protein
MFKISTCGAWFLPIATALWCNCASAQITPDATLPNNSIININGKTFNITGGTTAGTNLFHSFKNFSVPTGSEAFFNNTLGIQNIISRVTGGSISNIDGLIRTLGKANLFLINPNGIVFGPNASLNIGGSFVASTADSLKFEGGKEFSATNPQAPPLLTITIPLGLQFGSNPGTIVNQSQASFEGATNTFGSPAGLQVPNGKTLALVGGNVSLSGGNLTALGGRIELGSVDGDSFVNLNEIDTGYALGYQNVQKFRDIRSSNRAQVDTTDNGGGVIQVQGKNITLTDRSSILSGSFSQAGGNLIINAAESVKLSGGSFLGTSADGEGKAGDVLVKAFDSVELEGTSASGFPTFLFSQVCGFSSECGSATGNSGNITIETGRLLVRDGANIDSSNFGVGNAGNILIKASNSVDVIGTDNNPDNTISSGIRAQVARDAIDNPGNAGTLTIETQRLTVQGGAQISTAGRKNGNGGNLTINATDSILLSGASPFATGESLDTGRSGLFVSGEPGATGNVGSLNLATGLLSVEGGARISADNFGSGLPGSSTLNVRQLIIQNGGEVKSGSFAAGDGGTLTVNASESVDVVGTGTIGSTPVVSSLSAASLASGKAGNLNIRTPSLNVQDGGQVTVSGSSTGPAGNLNVAANFINLNQGSLTAVSKSGQDGNIFLQVNNILLMRRGSLISNFSGTQQTGGIEGNLNANVGFLVAVPNENNDIITNSFGGSGGDINITAFGIFNIAPLSRQELARLRPIDLDPRQLSSNDIIAISKSGSSFEISSFNIDLGLVKLPALLADTPQIADTTCAAFADGEGSSFTVTGHGGLPPSPYEPLSTDVLWSDTRIPNIASQQRSEKPSTKPASKDDAVKIVPATGWVFDGKGHVTLISHASNANNLGSTPACQNK